MGANVRQNSNRKKTIALNLWFSTISITRIFLKTGGYAVDPQIHLRSNSLFAMGKTDGIFVSKQILRTYFEYPSFKVFRNLIIFLFSSSNQVEGLFLEINFLKVIVFLFLSQNIIKNLFRRSTFQSRLFSCFWSKTKLKTFGNNYSKSFLTSFHKLWTFIFPSLASCV